MPNEQKHVKDHFYYKNWLFLRFNPEKQVWAKIACSYRNTDSHLTYKQDNILHALFYKVNYQ